MVVDSFCEASSLCLKSNCSCDSWISFSSNNQCSLITPFTLMPTIIALHRHRNNPSSLLPLPAFNLPKRGTKILTLACTAQYCTTIKKCFTRDEREKIKKKKQPNNLGLYSLYNKLVNTKDRDFETQNHNQNHSQRFFQYKKPQRLNWEESHIFQTCFFFFRLTVTLKLKKSIPYSVLFW